ncbi:MAG: alpha/beta hydrolase [Clostridiales bacterium]|nr:alpha/beta hydrolase [Clostridiales bacterium]
MKRVLIYVHGKCGNAEEAKHYMPLFPYFDIKGFDYKSNTPWEAKEEFKAFFEPLSKEYDRVILIANSIGAYFSMCAGVDKYIQKAYFISPIVDMEKLIRDMMLWANVTEDELKEKGVIHTAFGEDLSREYLSYVISHPVEWNVPTEILYGGRDNLTSFDTITSFAKRHNAGLTVMEDGEHWFHTEEQMLFLDEWINNKIKTVPLCNDK